MDLSPRARCAHRVPVTGSPHGLVLSGFARCGTATALSVFAKSNDSMTTMTATPMTAAKRRI